MGLQQKQFSEECWKQRICCMKRTRTQTRVKEEQLLSSVNEEEREESFEDSENSGAIVEEPVVSETTNRPMVTLLCQIPEGSNHNASAATVGIIKLLIWHFDLDPNRVFDIVLECFERQPVPCLPDSGV